MSSLLKGGPKTNHKKGYAAKAKAKRREEAEARNAKYASLPKEQKLKVAGDKVRAKLEKEAQ